MRSQAGASRLDTVLKLLLVAFISLLAFSSGVYFGKQMSDSDHQLKALENQSGKAGDETSAEVSKSLDQKSGDAVTDEDVTAASEKYMGDNAEKTAESAKGEEKAGKAEAKGSVATAAGNDEDVVVENHKTSAAKNAAAKAPAHVAAAAETGKPDLTEAKKTTERIVQNTKPEIKSETAAAAKAEIREPSSIPQKTINAEMAAPQYTVQIASYPTEADAKRQAADLVKKGFPAYPVEANVKGKTWYRVGVGSFKTQKEASDYRTQLLKQANLTAAIVQKVDR